MHTTFINDTVFIHNGDYSGDVSIRYKEKKDQGSYEINDQAIEIPITDLIDFVAEIQRNRLISKIEQMSSNELLNLNNY